MTQIRTQDSPVDGAKRWLFLLAGDARKASSRVRGYWIAEELRNLGARCTLMPCNSPLRIAYAALLIPFHDVVVFQKTYSRYHRQLQRVCLWLGKTSYIDIDDAPSKTQNPETLANFHSMCSRANAVLAGNPLLVQLARENGARAKLLPTGVRCRSYPVRRHSEHSPLCIGWIGDARQYIRDLQEILMPALAELASEHDIVFRVIGACGQDLQAAAGLYEIERIDELDWSSAAAVAAQLQHVDIGVYPLLSSDFNDCKSGFKALEYMACGIPVIATPNPANRDIIQHDVDGLLADTPAQWQQALTRLVNDPGLRHRLGSAGREKAARQYDTRIIANTLLAMANADTPDRK